MSTSQRDNRSSENSESTEFESDIETGAPNPNLNASQFETENGEQPNILTFNASQKRMFSSESSSDSEHVSVQPQNSEELPETNWESDTDSEPPQEQVPSESSQKEKPRPSNWIIESSSDDEAFKAEVENYLKDVQILGSKKIEKQPPLKNAKPEKDSEDPDVQILGSNKIEKQPPLKEAKPEKIEKQPPPRKDPTADPNNYSWNAQLKFWNSNSELLHSKMRNSKELLQLLVKAFPEKADSDPDQEIEALTEHVRQKILGYDSKHLEEVLEDIQYFDNLRTKVSEIHKRRKEEERSQILGISEDEPQFLERKDCEVPSEIKLPEKEKLKDGEDYVKAVHGMRVGPESGQIEWLTEFEAPDDFVYWILNSKSLDMNFEVNAFLDRNKHLPEFPEIEDSFLQKCIQDFLKARIRQRRYEKEREKFLQQQKETRPPPSSSSSESSEDDDPDWDSGLIKKQKGHRIFRW